MVKRSTFITALSARGYRPESKAFFERLATQPTNSRKRQYDTLIRALVSAGVWNLLDALYVWRAASQVTALTNLIQSSFGAAATGSPTFLANYGFTGASGKYIDSLFNPTTASGKYIQDSGTVFGWTYKAAQDAGPFAGLITAGRTQLTSRYTDNKYYLDVNMGTAGAGDSTGASTDGSGLWAATRSGANVITGYRNGVALVTGVGASGVLENDKISFLRGVSTAHTGAMGAAGIGAALNTAQHLALYNALLAYFTSINDIAFEGDSITTGSGASNGGYGQLYANTGPNASALINAVSASTTTTLASRATALDARLVAPARRHILTVLIGLNDFVVLGSSTATFLTALTSYCDARRAAGWYVVLCTLLPASDVGFNGTWRNDANTGIRAMLGAHADAICDFAAHPIMGVDGADTDTDLYDVIGEHPTDLGHTYLAEVMTPILSAL